ncbi:MAG: BMP family ABC transporter substrate-binding protein [Candidatus Accumulibacter sp.]|jgi:basic membrane protein A|nr:BMP family ABC transporter substrate-binding protein [Accumulibacter sp.]
MKKTHKIFSTALLFLMTACIALTGCERRTEAWKPGRPLARELLKIGVIHISNVEGASSGYAYAHDMGVRELQGRLGLKDEQIIRKFNVSDTDPVATEHSIRECIAQGANVIIATSWNHRDVCEKLAGQFPGVVFANATGDKRNESNLTYGFGRIYQPRYLSGIVAGLRTRTNKIGYVAAMGKDNSEVTGGLNAFALGVESVNPAARVHVRVTHRWFDPAGEALAARRLMEDGCDVIAQHSNTPGPQIEAQKAGKWGIGYNSDMRGEAPKAVMTSVVWNWGVYYTRLTQNALDGTFTTQPYLGDLKDGMVGITPFNEELVPTGAAEAVDAARKRMESGEFDGVEGALETNTGRGVGAAGARLASEEIASGMNWYSRSVSEP